LLKYDLKHDLVLLRLLSCEQAFKTQLKFNSIVISTYFSLLASKAIILPFCHESGTTYT